MSPTKKSLLAFALLASFAVSAAGLGCGNLFRPAPPRKPRLYCVEGRVLDAETRQGLSQVRVRLAAQIPTSGGTRTLTAYAVTRDDGSYEVELGEAFDVVRSAQAIRLDVYTPGYLTSGQDIPPPDKNERVYKLDDIVLVVGKLPAPANPVIPGYTPKPSRMKPLPWK